MKKTLITLALLGTATLASAQSWKFLPIVNDPAYKMQPSVALTVDRSKEDGLTATVFELSPRYMLPVGSGVSVGADLRWHDVRKKDGVNGDNTAFGVKVGMNF